MVVVEVTSSRNRPPCRLLRSASISPRASSRSIGIDVGGQAVLKKKLRRAEMLRFFRGLEPCLVGIEACATAHHWARQLGALGHTVRLMSPAYVKAYVRRQKTDAGRACWCFTGHASFWCASGPC